MALATVKDVVTKEFKIIREDDMLSSCLAFFKKGMPPVLIVVDKKNKYKGVIARRWIIRSHYDPSTTKVKKLTRKAPMVNVTYSLSKVAQLMIESEIRQLPVFDEDNLIGFITDEDIISQAVIKKWGKTKIEEIMSRNLFVVEEDDSLGSILSLFREQGISHAPVVKQGKLVGIISIQDLIEYIYKPKERVGRGFRKEKITLLSTPIKSIMTHPVITVLPETRMNYVQERMRESDVSSIIIVRDNRPIGIVTKRDFLEPIAQLEMKKPKITVQFSAKDIKINESQKRYILSDFESFARRYRETLEVGTLFIYLKTHGMNYKGMQLIHCRLQFRTKKGVFFSSSEAYGLTQTFRVALDRLERQILKSKELASKELTDRYLHRIQFPLSEL